MPPEVNARLVGRLGDTFWVVIKCPCGKPMRQSFRAKESFKVICRQCGRDVLPWFGELE